MASTVEKLCKNHEESRARAYLDGIWQDQANLAKYPGLRDSLEKRSQYYRSKGQPEPQFLEPLETRRCIYGIVDLHKGIVRVGAAGRVTKLDNPGRPLIARIGEHFYAGKKLQDYWLSRRAAVPQEIVEPTENHRYPLACFIAYYGKLRWAVMPLCHVPMPDPLVLETKGEWELAHAPYEADWIAYLRTELPWGLNKMRATERAKQQRASKSPYFAEWLMKFQGHRKFYEDMVAMNAGRDDNRILDGLIPLRPPVKRAHKRAPLLRMHKKDPRKSLGQRAALVTTVKLWARRIRQQLLDPTVFFSVHRNEDLMMDAYHILHTDPGRLAISPQMTDLLIEHNYLAEAVEGAHETGRGQGN